MAKDGWSDRLLIGVLFLLIFLDLHLTIERQEPVKPTDELGVSA